MPDCVCAHVEFDYRGQSFRLEAVIDLDACLQRGETEIDVLGQMAARYGIDLYSYEFEIMQQAEMWFDRAQGLAENHVQAGRFDAAGFVCAWRRRRVDAQLLVLAQALPAIQDEQQRGALLAVLRQAYESGRADAAHRADPAATPPEFR